MYPVWTPGLLSSPNSLYYLLPTMKRSQRDLYYLSDADLPGRNARSIQEMQMCQAFVENGLNVTHLHTRSIGKRKDTDWSDIATHYGISEQFSLRTFRTLQDRLDSLPKVETLSMAGPMALYVLMKILSGELDEADIIYSRNYYPTYFLCELKQQLPDIGFPTIVFEYHDIMNFRYQSRFFDIVDAVVCITEVLRGYTERTFGVDAERLYVAPDGVDLTRYEDWDKTQARSDLEFLDKERLVVYTGHLYRGKGAEVLARAANRISAEVYIVGGYPEDVDRVQKSVPETENLHFTGFVDPAMIPPYQIAADVLVAPYTQEARRFVSPLKLFEYMAAGCPIVATDLPVLHEVLTHEQNALLAEPGDECSLADEVNRLLSDEDLAARLSSAASADVNNYTWEQRATNILDYIDGLQAGR